MKGISAVIATILMLMITVAMVGVAYMYISGMFESKSQGLEVMDSYCSSGSAGWTVRNNGDVDIAAGQLTIVNVNEACTNDVAAANIGSASNVQFTATVCTTGRYHQYRMIGPSNAVELSVYCA